MVSISVSPHITYPSQKKNTPQRKEKRKIRKKNDTSFARLVEISSKYHDINWPATPSRGAHKNNMNMLVAQGDAASTTSTVVRGDNKEEVDVWKESKEDSKEDKKSVILSLPKEEKKIFFCEMK